MEYLLSIAVNVSDTTAIADHMAMIACHQTFLVKINICPVKSNLVRQIYCTLAMDKILSHQVCRMSGSC